LDNLIGFVAIKDVLLAVAEGPSSHQRKVKELVRAALFVPESREVGSLFLEMRQKQLQMAIVIDEYGGTAGLVTLEELVEEIVGRLSDELVVEPELVKAIDERTVLVDASLRIDEANEELGLNLPEGDDYETIAGFILYRLRHIPGEGEWMEEGSLRLTVGEMKGPRIEKVLISRL
jgi:CBS domain containing-hemolysin-like protein